MSTNENVLAGGANQQQRYRNTRGGPTSTATESYRENISLSTRTSINNQQDPSPGGHSANYQRNNYYARRGNGPRLGAAVVTRQNELDSAISRISDTHLTHASPTLHDHNRGNRSRKWRGRGAPNGRGGGQSIAHREREFRRQLTDEAPRVINNSSAESSSESAQYPANTPRSRSHTWVTARQRASKSEATDLTTRIHEDITNGHYECVICTNEVLPNSRIWTCEICWSVLHLSCVKRWFSNDHSMNQSTEGENQQSRPSSQWRCPGCNSAKADAVKNYMCWCAKEIEPRSIAGLPPHSCGQTCAKSRPSDCPHPCESICHAGPCPPCTRMGPSLPCFCRKNTDQKRCVDTKYKTGWSCDQICGKALLCQKHECQRKCHEGPCGSCEISTKSRCYCGKLVREIPCSKQSVTKESRSNGEFWTGSFDCGSQCLRKFDCGNPNHFCRKKCHPQDEEPAHCPFSPDVVEFCPCGKTSLSKILDEPRQDCSVAIPHCTESCRKILSCGHLCQQKCHNGKCIPCFESFKISCVCGRVNLESMCHQGAGERPHCPRICRATLNCGRHECGQRCCSGEKKATERQAFRRKHRALHAPSIDNSFEPEHICIRVCGRPLKCGNHSCTALCHKGSCASCLEAIFDEISCACGQTILQPPQPCGTLPPECNSDCHRRPRCGHPKVKHVCHQDSEPCPKCPFLVEKSCICGKKSLKNQPCWFSEARCGLTCGEKLKCGIHFCQKLCHREGQCEDSSTPCNQTCGRKRSVCEHSCSDRCHAPYPCKEDEPCQAKTFITCDCQNQKQPIKCLASKTSTGNTQKKLSCNDECLKTKRMAFLASALNVDPSTPNDHIPYSSKTLKMFIKYQAFAQKHEREFRAFAADDKKRVLRFKPMPAHHRLFVHSLASDFGLDSESQDAEPHRFVSIFKTPRFVSAPLKTLSQCSSAKITPAPSAPVAGLPQSARGAELYNAFLLVAPRFGLTIDEISTALRPEFIKSKFELKVSFIPSGDVTLRAVSSLPWSKKDERVLDSKKANVITITKDFNLAASATLCVVDDNLNVIRREDQSPMSNGGWNQVAKRGSSPKKVLNEGLGRASSFAILGKLEKAKEQKIIEDAPDDWEKEVDGWT